MMTDWHVRVEYPSHIDTDQAETVGEQLVTGGAMSAVVDGDRGRVRITVAVTAGTLRAGLDEGLRHADQVARQAGITDRAVRVEAVPVDDVAAEVRRPMLPALAGITEAAAILGVPRQRVAQLAAQHPDFPTEVAVLASGRVYTEASIRAFNERWERKPGRPRKDAKDA